MRNTFIDLKLRMSFQPFPHCCFRIIARPPRPIKEHFLGHVFNHGIEHHAVAAFTHEWSICLQFGEYMGMSVVAIEANQCP